MVPREAKSVYFTDEHRLFRETVRGFMEEEVAPHADDWEREGRIPRTIYRRMGELGFLGVTMPEKYGGSGGDLFFALVLLEELPRSRAGGFCASVSVQQFMATQHLYEWGSEELRRRYLVPSIQGEAVGALAVTEPDAGSDVASIRTTAVREGNGFVIRGAKTFITNGADGSFFTVAAKTDPEAGAEGISLFTVDADAAGVQVAKRLEKIGWHSSDTAELFFDGVRVPGSSLIGRENQGFYYLMEAFQLERLAGAAVSVGSAELCLEVTAEYMQERKAFGRPLSRMQALTHRVADLWTRVEASRQLTYQAAWLMQEGHPAQRECSMAKLMAGEVAKETADACLQFFGGYGIMEEYPMARFLRDSRPGTIVAGTSEIMREILSRMIFEGHAPGPVGEGGGEGRGKASAQEPEPSSATALGDTAWSGVPDSWAAEDLIRSLPGRLRKDQVEGWEATFHYTLQGAEPPTWTVVVDNGVCTVQEGHQGIPDCTVTTAADTYVGIERGDMSPQVAYMTGKVKVSDIAEMTRFTKAFTPVER